MILNGLTGLSLKMSNKYPASAYTQLLKEFEIDLRLSDDQSVLLSDEKEFALSAEQMSNAVQQICSILGTDKYLTQFISSITPLRLSVFVFNDALWNMMMKKSWQDSREQMLAMSTIPLCTWEQKEEKTSNPKGVCRHDVWPNDVTLELNHEKVLIISGRGGDFAGFIERSHRTARKWGIPEKRDLIPNYEFTSLRLEIDLKQAEVSLKPTPRDDLDYDFSESARFFFDNGLSISLPEGSVTLTSGSRKPATMKGNALILLGHHEEENPYKNLLSSMWFWAFANKIGEI